MEIFDMAFRAPFWSPSEASAILFDWDGVIADTRLDFSMIREKYYGDRPAMLLEDANTLPPEKRESLLLDLEELETEGAAQATLVPGIAEILEWVEGVGMPWAVVSRNCRKSILTAAEAIGVRLPEITRSRDDGDCVKPDPRALRETCSLLEARPSQTLLVGDYIYDMIGARRAGMRGVLVRGEIGEGWDEWLECRYTSMPKFYEALTNPTEITAWEYLDTFKRYGATFLRQASELFLRIPESASPGLDSWVAQASSLGVGGFYVGEGTFTPEMWRQNPSLEIECMGMSLEKTLMRFLENRWPLARVVRDDGAAIYAHPPRDADDLPEFLLSIVDA
jgi:HAD superfamily hydrolase (TIGR01509 family)